MVSRIHRTDRRSPDSSIWRQARAGLTSWPCRSRQPTSACRTGLPADAILALVHLRAGDYGEAEGSVRKLFDQFKTDPSSTAGRLTVSTLWTIGLELDKHPATRDLAVTALEDS